MDAGQVTTMLATPVTGMTTAASVDLAATMPVNSASAGAFGILLAQTMTGITITEMKVAPVSSSLVPADRPAESSEGTQAKRETFFSEDVDREPVTTDQLVLVQSQMAALQMLVSAEQPVTEPAAMDSSSVQTTGISATVGSSIDGIVQQSEISAENIALRSSDVTQAATKPATVEAKPVMTEARSVMTEARPVTTEAKPVTTEAKPVIAEARPVTAEAKPVTAEARPVTTEAKAVTAEAKAVTAEARSVTQNLASLEPLLAVEVSENIVAGKNEGTLVAPKPVMPALSGITQAKEELPVQVRSSQEADLRTQGTTLQAKVSTSGQPEVQRIAEAQLLPQELLSGTKTTTTAVPNPVKFAQPMDVVAATADTSGQDGLSSNPEQQGAQLIQKMAKVTPVVVETAQPEIFAGSATDPRSAVHNLVNPQTGHQVVTAKDVVSTESSHTVVPEQISRQVMERLASHEIKQGNEQISFKLSPENLGNLQLNMRMEDHRLKLEIVAENREVRNALLQQSDELRETLAKQNIRLDSFDVTTGNSGNSSQQSSDWRQTTSEQRQYQMKYAAQTANTSGSFETPVRYFESQYKSTLDVRF